MKQEMAPKSSDYSALKTLNLPNENEWMMTDKMRYVRMIQNMDKFPVTPDQRSDFGDKSDF